MANRELKIQGTKVGLDVNELSIYRTSIDPTNLLAAISKKQFINDGYTFTDDDTVGVYMVQADNPCLSTMKLSMPYETTTTTTAPPGTTTTTTSTTTTTTTTTTQAPATTTTTQAPGPTTTSTTTQCTSNCEAYTCGFHGQGWFNVSYDGASQTATITAYFSDQTITSGGYQTGLTPNSGTQYRNVSFRVDNGYFTNSGQVITCSAAINTSYTPPTTTTTTQAPATTTTTTQAPATTTTTTQSSAVCYSYSITADGGDTVTVTYMPCNGRVEQTLVVANGTSDSISCAEEGSVSMSPNSGSLVQGSQCN